MTRRAGRVGWSRLGVILASSLVLSTGRGSAVVRVVPDDFGTIQAALDAARPGDVVRVRARTPPYNEKITFPKSGDGQNGWVTLEAFPGERPVIDGTGVAGQNLVLIENRSYVRVAGFELRNNLEVNDGSGIRVLGAGSHIELRDNVIHEVRGRDAMGITVYGTESEPISDLTIDGNEIYDCEPFQSEALTLNGNVTNFAVTNNVVRDVNNIGIDFIGGETDIQPDVTRVARSGLCRGNQVYRAREQGGGFAAGIYVDGGRDIVVENNLVTGCDLGIEIGAENVGIVTSGIVVRNNLVLRNEKAGIVFGGFAPSVGRVRESRFLHNTCFENDLLGAGFGELWIQYAEGNEVRNNIFRGGAGSVLLSSEEGDVGNVLDYNLWYSPDGEGAVGFVWRAALHAGFATYQTASGQDGHSRFGDPLFADAAGDDFHLQVESPAVDAGDPAFVPAAGEVDLDGEGRVNGTRVDIGADEASACGNSIVDGDEQCDDGNLADGDGCDRNCTRTACGNGVVSTGEECDSGGVPDGCCSDACRMVAEGGACDDGDACTVGDACDGSGVCRGRAEPELECRVPVHPGKSRLVLRRRDDGSGSLLWKWSKGQATAVADFGDPSRDDAYTLCVYDASGDSPPVFTARLPPGSAWSRTSSGIRYRERSGFPDGILVAELKAGEAGKALIKLKGKGENLRLPDLGLQLPVNVQLRESGGGCWGATFSHPIRNESSRFEGLSD